MRRVKFVFHFTLFDSVKPVNALPRSRLGLAELSAKWILQYSEGVVVTIRELLHCRRSGNLGMDEDWWHLVYGI